MEIKYISMESEVFQDLMNEISSLRQSIDEIKQNKNKQEWLDVSQVCEMLNIKKRTVQNYKGKLLPYTKLRGKILFRKSDIEHVLKENYTTIKKMRYGKL